MFTVVNVNFCVFNKLMDISGEIVYASEYVYNCCCFFHDWIGLDENPLVRCLDTKGVPGAIVRRAMSWPIAPSIVLNAMTVFI